MNIPVFDGSRIVVVAGVGNKTEEYDESDVQQLTLFMEGMWRLIERKRVEEELRQSEDNFKHSLDDSPLAIRIVTEKGDTIYTNKSLLNLYKFKCLNDFLETPINKRYTPEELERHNLRKEKRKKGEDLCSGY